jgi:HEPN domain-containing protein
MAYEVSAFLAHPAVEKLLKGAWIEVKRARPPVSAALEEGLAL